MRNKSNSSVRKVWIMDAKVARWWWVEVVREEVSNDNEDMVSWVRRWSDVADMMAAKKWRAQEVAVRQMVAVTRQNNRPKGV